MLLPTKASPKDIEAVCNYFIQMPSGASTSEFMAKFGKSSRHTQTRTTCNQLRFIERGNDGRTNVTERGRRAVWDNGKYKAESYLEAISDLPAYRTIIEKAESERRLTITVPEVSSFWQKRFGSVTSKTDSIRIEQVISFFRFLEEASLGEMASGRRGQKTQFDFNADSICKFAKKSEMDHVEEPDETPADSKLTGTSNEAGLVKREFEAPQEDVPGMRTVFISHGGNRRILDQVRELFAFGKFEVVGAREHETVKPAPEKVMNDMRFCRVAVIYAGADRILQDEDGREVHRINDDALIDIGAAMALCGRNIVLLVEAGAELPSGLGNLHQCRYSGEELDGQSIMNLLRVLNDLDSN